MESDSLRHRGSQDTMISLMQLDPTPMDVQSPNEKELPALPEEAMESSTSTLRSQPASTASTSTVGLSSSGKGAVYYLTRIQRYSSYTFTFFAGLHLANTSLIPLLYKSVPSSEPFLLMARELYQTPLTEPLLVGLPIIAHASSGLALRLIRRSHNLKRYGGATPGVKALHRSTPSSSISSKSSALGPHIWPPLSYISASGYFFGSLLVLHVGLNRVIPLVVEGDSSNIGLQYVAHGFTRHTFQPWVFYSLLLTVGVGHMVWGWAKWMSLAPPMNWENFTIDKAVRKSRRRAWWGINAAAALLTLVWAAGGLGIVARAGRATGWLGDAYDTIYSFAWQ